MNIRQTLINSPHRLFVDVVSRLLSGRCGLCVLLHRTTVWWMPFVTFALYFLRDLCGYFFTAKDAKFFAKFTKRTQRAQCIALNSLQNGNLTLQYSNL